MPTIGGGNTALPDDEQTTTNDDTSSSDTDSQDTTTQEQVPDDINRGRRRPRRTAGGDTDSSDSSSDSADTSDGGEQQPPSTVVERAAGLPNTEGDPAADTEQQVEQTVSDRIRDQVVSESSDLTDESQVRVTNVRQTDSGEFTGDVTLTDQGRAAVARRQQQGLARRARNPFARQRLRQEAAEGSAVTASDVQVTTQDGFGTTFTQGGQMREQQRLEQDILTSRFNRKQFADQVESEQGASENSIAVGTTASGGLALERTVGGRSRLLVEQAAENTQFEESDLNVTTGSDGQLTVEASDRALREQAAANSEYTADQLRVVDRQQVRPSDQRLYRESGVENVDVSADAETGETTRQIRLTDEAARAELRERVEAEYPNAEFEIVDGEDGPSVEFTERFDDDGRFLGIAGGESAVEGAADAFQSTAGGVIDASARYGTGAVYDNILDVSGDLAGVDVESDGQFQQASEDIGEGAAAAVNPFEGALALDEVGEVAGAGLAAGYNQQTGVDPDALTEFQSEAVEAGEFIGGQAYTQATERPFQTAGTVGAAAVTTYGAFRLAGSASSTAGRATQIVIEPGEELLRYGGRAGVSGARRAAGAVARSTDTTRQIRRTLGEVNAQRPQVRVVDRDGGGRVQVSDQFSRPSLPDAPSPTLRGRVSAPDIGDVRTRLADSAFRTRERLAYGRRELRSSAQPDGFEYVTSTDRVTDTLPTSRSELSDAIFRTRERLAYGRREFRASARPDTIENVTGSGDAFTANVPTSRGEVSDALFRTRERLSYGRRELRASAQPDGFDYVTGSGDSVTDAIPTSRGELSDALFRTRERLGYGRREFRASARPDTIENVTGSESVTDVIPTNPAEVSDALFRARERFGYRRRELRASAQPDGFEYITSSDGALDDIRRLASGDAALRIEPGRPPKQDTTLDVRGLDVDETPAQELSDLVDADDLSAPDDTSAQSADGDLTSDVSSDSDAGDVFDARTAQAPDTSGQVVVSETVDAGRRTASPRPDTAGGQGAGGLALTQSAESVDLSPDAVDGSSFDIDTPAGVDAGGVDTGLADEATTNLGDDIGFDSPLDSAVERDVGTDLGGDTASDLRGGLGEDTDLDLGIDGRTGIDTSLDIDTDLGLDTPTPNTPNPDSGRRGVFPDLDAGDGRRRRDPLLFDDAEERFDYGDIELR